MEDIPTPDDRRSSDRRQVQEGETSTSLRRSSRQPFFKAIILITAGVLIWQWRFLTHAPIWLVRRQVADRSNLYQGHTNGIPNKSLVDQARNYLTDVDHVDASGNLTAPEALRPLGVHLDMAWFRHHAPDNVDFNPFLSDGRFVVSWLYYPGCQKTIKPSLRTDTDWYNLRGRPCFPLCRVSVRMGSDLKLTTIKLDIVQPS